jgi:hypothetical protein
MRTKGTPKTGGREKGSLNRQTAEIRSFVAELVQDSRDKIKDDIASLDPDKRLMYFEKLLQYVLPKPMQTQFPLEDGLTRLHYGNNTYTVTDKEMEGKIEDERIPTFKEIINNVEQNTEW